MKKYRIKEEAFYKGNSIFIPQKQRKFLGITWWSDMMLYEGLWISVPCKFETKQQAIDYIKKDMGVLMTYYHSV